MMQQLKKLRLIMVVCLILSTFSSLYSQVIDSKQYNYVGNWYNWQGGRFINNLNIPKVTATTGRDTGAIRYALADSSIYVWTGSQWRQIGGGGSGSADSSVFATRYYTQQTFVPYTGATGSVNLGAFGLTTDRLVFNQTPTLAGGVGIVRWNDTDGTLEFGMKGGNVTQQIGQELPVRMRNNTGSTILNGEAVYISGSTGSSTIIAKARADASSTSKATIGLLTEDIANGQSGYVTVFGKVRDINTSALTEGELVYLSSTVAGGLTSTPPTGDTYHVVIGVCERSHAVNGVIFVHIDKEYVRQYDLDTALANRLQNITGLVTAGTGIDVTGSGTSGSPYVVSLENVDSSAARVRTGTYAQRVAISSPVIGDVFTQTDRLKGLYFYNGDGWDFQGTSLQYIFFNQFNGNSVLNAGYNTTQGAVISGAGASAAIQNASGTDGYVNFGTGTTSSGHANTNFLGGNSLTNMVYDSLIVYTEYKIQIPTLSDGTDRFQVAVGGTTSTSSYNFPAFVFYYSDNNNSGQWSTITRAHNSGSLTIKNTAVAVTAGAWVKLAIEIDSYADQIKFYIDDVLVQTHTSADNTPLNGAITWGVNSGYGHAGILKTVGTTSRSMYLNYAFAYITKRKY